MTTLLPKIALTIGDVCGIGPEITLKSYMSLVDLRDNLIIIGDPSLLQREAKSLNIDIRFNNIGSLKDLKSGCANVLNPSSTNLENSSFGKPDERVAQASISYIDAAVDLAIKGDIGGFVTGPINKNSISKIIPGFRGHTEYISSKCGAKTPVMLMISDKLKVIPLTTHIALKDVSQSINALQIINTLTESSDGLKKYFSIKEPRIAVSGLNPHGGYDEFGSEERDIIAPAIKLAGKNGISVSGPYPADSLFSKIKNNTFDAILAMYHDQALIPVKASGLNKVVNVTLGLPFIRTSPGHGTAYDIAGKSIADPQSMINAVRVAFSMAISHSKK